MQSLYRFLAICLVITFMAYTSIQYTASPAFAQESDNGEEISIEVEEDDEELQLENEEQDEEDQSEEQSMKKNEYDEDNILVLETKHGEIHITMFPDVAPNHVNRIKELVRQNFYDGVVFHRVIDGFMAQTGDPTGTGTGGSGQKLEAEFSDKPHLRGAVSMARAQDPDSADSQFFIVFEDSRFLDKKYTVWGHVTSGLDVVDKIKRGDPARNGMVTDPDKVISMRVLFDANQEEINQDAGEIGGAESSASQAGN